jgi:hypothetical protein
VSNAADDADTIRDIEEAGIISANGRSARLQILHPACQGVYCGIDGSRQA